MVRIRKLNKSNIRKALEIYYQEAYGREAYHRDMLFWTNNVFDQLDDCNYAELRIGIPYNGDTKFRVFSGSRTERYGSNYALEVDTNDHGMPEKLKKKLIETKDKIEQKWKEAGFPVMGIVK